jgi:hypothetical protein
MLEIIHKSYTKDKLFMLDLNDSTLQIDTRNCLTKYSLYD